MIFVAVVVCADGIRNDGRLRSVFTRRLVTPCGWRYFGGMGYGD